MAKRVTTEPAHRARSSNWVLLGPSGGHFGQVMVPLLLGQRMGPG
jgi:hypothetical protein